jgi:hypothetical protein
MSALGDEAEGADRQTPRNSVEKSPEADLGQIEIPQCSHLPASEGVCYWRRLASIHNN